MKKFFLVLSVFFVYINALFSQLSGTKYVPTDYPTLADAINALNTQGVGSGGVIIVIENGNNQIAPSGGYVLTASGTADDPIIIDGNGNTVIAYSPQPSGSINDAIFKIIGGDYITIRNFTLLENSGNTNTTIASNTMTEFGIALYYSTPQNGPQNITIFNNYIRLKITYPNSLGIYANSRHNSTDPLTPNEITSVNGAFNNLSIIQNVIDSVNMGIVLIGANNGNYMAQNIKVLGNTINFGRSSSISSYVSISQTVNGILLNNNLNFNINNNTIISQGTTISGALRGIYCYASGTIPTTGNYVHNIKNNEISINSRNNGLVYGIFYDIGNQTITTNIEGNEISGCGYINVTSPTSNASGIYLLKASLHNNIRKNIIEINNNTSGTIYAIFNNAKVPDNGSLILDSNYISVIKPSSSGSVYGYYSFSTSSSTVNKFFTNNTFENFNLSGTTTLYCIYEQDGLSGNAPSKFVNNNKFLNIVGGDGTIQMININYGIHEIKNNEIYNITSRGDVTCIMGGGGNTTNLNISNNKIYNITTNSGNINGIVCSAGASNSFSVASQNEIYNLTTYATSGKTVAGISISAGTTVYITNNFISALYSPNNSNVLGIAGITALNGTSVNLIHNTIYLDANSAGADFGTACIVHSTPTINLTNNILTNNSTAKGNGYTLIYRKMSTTLSNYSTESNNNLFYVDTTITNNYIFYDGSTFKKGIGVFKSYVTPRETYSQFELPPFVNINVQPYDLHINVNIPTFAESGGKLSAIVNDIDGEPRYGDANYNGNGIAPDIGADEFEGTFKFTCQNINLGNTIANPSIACYGQPLQLSVQNIPTGTGIIYQWKKSYNGTDYINIPNSNSSSLVYNFNDNSGVFFTCYALCLNDNSENYSTPVFVDFANKVLSVAGDTLCGIGEATITAEVTSGAQAVWFTSQSGNIPVYTGSTYTTEMLYNSTTFYVEAQTQSPITSNIGIGNNTSTGYESPFYHLYGGKKSQYLIRASELINAGFSAGSLINSLGFEIVNAATNSYNNFSLKIGATSVSSLNSSTFITGLTQVYTNPSLTLTNGINTLNFNQPFVWNGVSNIVVEFCWSNNNSGGASSTVKYDNTTFNSQAYYRADNQSADVLCAALTPTSTMTARPKFILNGASICSSPRVPVNVIVNPASSVNITNDTTVCYGSVIPITILSGASDYNEFTWQPSTNLFLDPQATQPYTGSENITTVYYLATNVGSSKIYCYAYDNIAHCTNVDSITVVTLPSDIIISSSASYICQQGSVVLSIPNQNYGEALIQWYISNDGANYQLIVGANSTQYTSNNLTDTTYFKVEIINNSQICVSEQIMIPVGIPFFTQINNNERCGEGTVELSVQTPSQNITTFWYQTISDTSILGVGNNFTTPVISSTTSYWAEPVLFIDTIITGNVTPASMLGSSNQSMYFSSANNVIIKAINVYPASSGTLTIRMYDNNNVLKAQRSFTILSSDISSTVPKTLTLNFNVPAGATLWRLSYDISLYRASGSFPYSININGFAITGNSYDGSSITSGTRYYLFNWVVHTICNGVRQQVVATVNPAPIVTINASSTEICEGTQIQLQAVSSNQNYQYTWSGGTIPQTGNSVTAQPSETTTYWVSAYDTNGCNYTASVTINVHSIPITNVTANNTNIYCGSQVLLAASPTYTPETVIKEKFNTATYSFTSINNSTGGNVSAAAWTLRPDGYTYSSVVFHSNDNSQFIMSNSDAQGSGSTTNTSLISNPIDATQFDSLVLKFYHYYRHYQSSAKVNVFDGTTWQTLQTWVSNQGTSGNFVLVTLPIPPQYFNANFKIAFQYNANYGYYWAIDNVELLAYNQNTVTWTSIPIGFTSNVFNTSDVPTTTTTYIATISSVYNCQSADSITISVNNLPAPTLTVQNNCGYSSIIASNYNGIIYWSDGNQNVNTITVNTPQPVSAYYVVGQCTSSVAQVMASPIEIPQTPTVNTVEACYGQTLPAFQASSNYNNFIWYADEQLTQQVGIGSTYQPTQFQVGTYYYYVVAVNNNCQSQPAQAMATIHPLPAVTITQNVDTLYAQVSSTSTVSYQWYNAQGPIAGATDSIYVVTQENDYYVIVIDQYGCSSFSNILHVVPSSIASSAICSSVIVTPNPATDFLYITLFNFTKAECELISYDGKIVFNHKNLKKHNVINISEITRGVYTLRIKSEKDIFITKVIIK
ncbi:MAG: T9SS type A sorting domain-containing protein [Bacteroidales bacterium]|nr:T9SS type A sorting domain-containing protein [Bacteroidales bacterium]